MPAKSTTLAPAVVRVKAEPGSAEAEQAAKRAAIHKAFGSHGMRRLFWSANESLVEPAVYGREAKVVMHYFIEEVVERAVAAVMSRQHTTIGTEDIHQALDELGVAYVGGGAARPRATATATSATVTVTA